AIPGAAVAAAGTASLWWTSGANAWLVDVIAPYGATGADVAIALAVAVLVAAGAGARSQLSGVSSWLADGPGLALGASWLVSTQLEPGADWATVGALAFGTAALAIGGIRRLAAPLVIGTVTIGATIVVSAGARLAAAPTW